MTELVEVAIEMALIGRAQAFAAAQTLEISLPNIDFIPPDVSKTAKYLRASILPADTATIGISNSSNDHHLGLFQIDVFYGVGSGEYAPRRIAAAIVSYFKRGTRMKSNGFNIDVLQTPRLGPQLTKDVWTSLPVRIPYTCFAIPA